MRTLMNGEPRPVHLGDRWNSTLTAPERGSAPPEMIWWTLAPLAVFGAIGLCLAYLFGRQVIPLWLSWVLVAAPLVPVLLFTVVDLMDRIKDRRSQKSVAP